MNVLIPSFFILGAPHFETELELMHKHLAAEIRYSTLCATPRTDMPAKPWSRLDDVRSMHYQTHARR